MTGGYLWFAEAARMRRLMSPDADESARLHAMLSWCYLVIVRESMLLARPETYRFPSGFRRDDTDFEEFGRRLGGVYLYSYEVGFRGGMGLDGPLLRFFEAELAAFVAWAGEQGVRGASLWDTEKRLLPMALAWFGGFSPSAPRQTWFKGACLDPSHQQLFADLAAWKPS
jgi:hypothetical protein